MAVKDQEIADRYALYMGDCIEVMKTIPDESVHLSIYSPPFGGLYCYSSSERDLSNTINREEFFDHYRYAVEELCRVAIRGRVTAVHCMDFPLSGVGEHIYDFPGDIIRLHEEIGFRFMARYFVWKEPLGVRNRTMMRSLAHMTVVNDSSRCSNAIADQLLIFRAPGNNPEPIAHPVGLTSYAGSRQMPAELLQYRGWTGKQTENRFSHWIWRQYASAFWDDVRLDRVLQHKPAKDEEDESHIHPLQLDVIERCLTLWSNPDDKVLSPFMGVGSEIYGALMLGRRGVGIELKESYYRQAVKNVREAIELSVRADSNEQVMMELG